MRATGRGPQPSGRRFVAAALLVLLVACTGCAGCFEPSGRAPDEPVDDSLDDYLAVAFGNRLGPPPEVLRKWPASHGAVVLRPTGEPTYEDRVHLRLLVRELNATLEHLDLDLAEWDERPADVEIRFAPLAGFAAPATSGADYPARFDCRADAAGRLRSGLLLLPSDADVPQYMRFNLLAEGLAACLGLAGTSDREAESAFYGPPNWYEEGFTRRDLALVALHDRPDLTPGLSRAQAAARLDR